MWKIIQPWGWSGTPHELFDVIDPYAVKHREFRKMAKARSVHPDVDAFVERELPSMKSSRYLYILTSNMGADETWGSNVNSDSFERKALAYKGSDWGIETFKTAGIFKDHKNTDKAKSYGDIVFVTFASAEDGYMDRVESIVRLDRERASKVGASDVIHSIEHGNYPAWSMGCFKKGTLISFPGGVMKPIEEVREGDLVVTHKGRERRVLKTICYKYNGRGMSIKAAGQPPIECTEEHPFLVLREFQTEWVRADQLQERDTLLLPLPKKESGEKDRGWSEEKLWMFGVYLAEGYLHHTKGHHFVTFCLGGKEDLTKERLRSFGESDGWSWFSERKARNGLYLTARIPETKVSEFLSFGRVSHEKTIPKSVFSLSSAHRISFLSGWFDGDGGQSPRRGVYLSSSNRMLLQQASYLLTTLGFHPSWCTLNHNPSTIVSKKTVEFRLTLPLEESNAIVRGVPRFKHRVSKSKKPLQQRDVELDGVSYISTPIQTIHEIRVDEDVFNFEVEEDNSYIAERFAVHNCRVSYDVCSFCANQAPNRAAYCVHMKKYPNAVLTETFRGKPGFESMKDHHLGLRIRVFNPKPKFFDFSKVFIGAAAEAKTLQKLASQHHLLLSSDLAEIVYGDAVKLAEEKQSALRKRSEIDKRIEPQQDAPVGATLKLLSDREPRLEEPLLKALESAPFAQGLSSLAGCGMMLKPPEFQRLALGGLGFPSLGKELWDNDLCFDPQMHCNPEPCPPIRMDLFLRGLAQLFLSLVPQRSLFHPPLVKRMMVIRIRPSSGGKSSATSEEGDSLKSMLNSIVGEEKTSSVRVLNHPTLTKIAGMYQFYKHALAEFLHDNGMQMLSLYPELRNAVCASLPTFSKEASPLLSALTFQYIASV